MGNRRREALWLSTHGFAESDLLFEIDVNAHLLSAELPELEKNYRQGEASAGVLMLIRWGRKVRRSTIGPFDACAPPQKSCGTR